MFQKSLAVLLTTQTASLSQQSVLKVPSRFKSIFVQYFLQKNILAKFRLQWRDLTRMNGDNDLKDTLEKMKSAGHEVADWIQEMLDAGFESFYKVEDGKLTEIF